MDNDAAGCAWGEFGRAPKINKEAGRDHWPNVSRALLTGGGLRTGQVIGSADRASSEIKNRPVHFQKIIAKHYRCLDIDLNHATLPNLVGRPHIPWSTSLVRSMNCCRKRSIVIAVAAIGRSKIGEQLFKARIARTRSIRVSIVIGVSIRNAVVRRDRSVLNKRDSYLAPGMGDGPAATIAPSVRVSSLCRRTGSRVR